MYLLLSADGDIGLYKVILENFDTIITDFFKWKRKIAMMKLYS